MLLVWILLLSFNAFTTSSKSEPEKGSVGAGLESKLGIFDGLEWAPTNFGLTQGAKSMISNAIGLDVEQIIDGQALEDGIITSRMAQLGSCLRYEHEQNDEENIKNTKKWLDELKAEGCEIDPTQTILARDHSFVDQNKGNMNLDYWSTKDRKLEQKTLGVKFIWFQTIPNCKGKKTFVIGHVGTDFSKLYDIMSDLMAISLITVELGGQNYMAGAGFAYRWKDMMALTVDTPTTSKDGDAAPVPTTVRDRILYEIAKENPDEIRVVGHSLGGALASLHAVDLAQNPSITQPVKLSTYGAPRVFAKARDSFKRAQKLFPVDGTGSNVCFRYVNYGDVVPSVPQSALSGAGFQHFGKPLYINKDNWDTWNLKPEQDVDFTPWNNLDPREIKFHFLEAYIERLDAIQEVYKRGGGQNGKIVKEVDGKYTESSAEEHAAAENSVASSKIQDLYPFELLAVVFFFGTACIFSIQRKFLSASAIEVHLLDEEEH